MYGLERLVQQQERRQPVVDEEDRHAREAERESDRHAQDDQRGEDAEQYAGATPRDATTLAR